MVKTPRRVREEQITTSMALLPAVPFEAAAAVPSLMVNRRKNWQVRRLLSYMHLAAIVTACGAIPKDVYIEEVILQRSDALPDEPRLLATRLVGNDYGSLIWFETFQHGLDKWKEAGFSDPVELVPHQEDGLDGYILTIKDYESYIQHCLNALKLTGNVRGYDNLKGFRMKPETVQG